MLPKRTGWSILLVALVFAATVLPPAGADEGQRVSPVDLPDVPVPTITSPPSEAELEDIAVAAEEFGLSMAAAIEQYGWRDNFSLLAGEVAGDFPDDFARAEIASGNTAWIAFAGSQPRETRQLVGQFRSAFPHVTVQVRPNVGYTATELNDAIVAIHNATMARPEVVDAVTEYLSSDNAISATASTRRRGPTVSVDELRAELELPEVNRLPESVAIRVSVVEDVKLSGDDNWNYHYGGEDLSGCTSGFGVRYGNHVNGTRGISTAGHCADSLTDDGLTLTFQGGYDGYWGDFQWHTGSGIKSDDFYSGSSTGLEVNLRDVSSDAWANTGNWLCTNGKTTHKECDTVRNTDICSGENCGMFGMENRQQAGGDSGAPVFNGNKAYGLHEGWYTSGGKARDTKSQARYMPDGINCWVAYS